MMNTPNSYQEWMDCFELLVTERIGTEDILKLEKGTLPSGSYIADKFQRRVVQTVDEMLKRIVKRFNHSLKEAMETGDFQSIPYICKRTKKDMEYCYFYEHILFLEPFFLEDLTKEVKSQMELFWKSVLSEIERIYRDTYLTDLEDIIYSLKRMNKSGV